MHEPVLRERVVELLAPAAGKVLVDGTLGTGGHAEALLARGARVIGIDWDDQALALAGARLDAFGERFVPVRANFAELPSLLDRQALPEVDGIVLDLGVSSLQLENAARGFSFQRDGPLDMRMSPDLPRTAADVLEALDERELADLLRRNGEERFARRIARAIVREQRQRQTLWRTRELGDLIVRAAPRRLRSRLHPATRVFLALRIAVNDELSHFSRFLDVFDKCLRGGARLVVLSYHSLEDRLAKRAFLRLAREGRARILTRKPERPGPDEVARNPRARSARLRALEMA